ncbi:MAG: AB hydrolase superfamily protein YdjP [Spirochaetes bacterium ADurb.Bin218]|jgi:pimeloyl-ACP methyl ester carboxylesterase|nr:MAG: AB hydrolase superfamily protein YdjP [Spirochaetes bacterium ADurb.Bin218]
MGISLNYIEKDSKKIFYRKNGDENRNAMIFIHGLAGDSRFFHNQLKYFGERFKTIAIDLPGHGRSKIHLNQSLELYSKAISEIAATENIKDYILIAHSMGGAVALEHLKEHQERVKAIILVSTAAQLPIEDKIVNEAQENFEVFFHKTLSLIFNKKAGLFIIAARKQIDEEEKAIIINDLLLCKNSDYRAIVPAIKIPALLIANRYDKIIPCEATEHMHRQLQNSKFVVFDQRGHIPFFENSEEFNRVVDEFIASLPEKQHSL